MRITTVILDFDGTLGDSRRIIVDTLRETLRQHGLPQNSEDECAATIGLPLKEAFVRLANVDDATAMACVATYRSIFDIHNVTGAVKPFANVVQTVERMHAAGLTLTIASSRGRDSLPSLVRSIGIGQCRRRYPRQTPSRACTPYARTPWCQARRNARGG